MTEVAQTLIERGKTHGHFDEHAMYTQMLKNVYMHHNGLCPGHREALDMICHKMGRILAGDPYHKDHWHDIAGYALLAEEISK